MRQPLAGTVGRRIPDARRWKPPFVAASLSLAAALTAAAEDENLTNEVRVLREQNAQLQQQLQKQNNALDALTKKVEGLEAAESARETAAGENPAPAGSGFNLGKINLSAEGGVAFFDTGTSGFAPHPEFRVDEARLFVEAPIWKEVYFYSDVDLATRENTDLQLYLGELYLEGEDISQLWGEDGQLNLRVGRLNIPFGEEYMYRYAMENPLISHSLSDLWGIDPGVELYGKLGRFSYVAAVQNGGANGVQDFDGDKSVAGRLSFDPDPHWHFSVSGMRTGHLNVQQDSLSATWFGGGWFRGIGSPATTRFDVDLVEGDLAYRWKSGHVSAFGGYAHYEDNDPIANNDRDLFYYSIEAMQDLPHKFYTAARFSQIFASHGYPLTGFGQMGKYLFDGILTRELWRLSLGLGYRFSNNFEVKAEYSFENGRTVGGNPRDNEDFFGTEAAFKF